MLETLWDLNGTNHPMITSMREHRGHLYLGGIMNNRIGRYKIPGPIRISSNMTVAGGRGVIGALRTFTDQLLGRGAAAITVPIFDGALNPNQILEQAETFAELEAPENLATDGTSLLLPMARASCDMTATWRPRWHRLIDGSPASPTYHAAVSRSIYGTEVRIIGGPHNGSTGPSMAGKPWRRQRDLRTVDGRLW